MEAGMEAAKTQPDSWRLCGERISPKPSGMDVFGPSWFMRSSVRAPQRIYHLRLIYRHSYLDFGTGILGEKTIRAGRRSGKDTEVSSSEDEFGDSKESREIAEIAASIGHRSNRDSNRKVRADFRLRSSSGLMKTSAKPSGENEPRLGKRGKCTGR